MTPTPALVAWLALIGYAEGASYNTIVSGVDGPHTFTDFSQHPFASGRAPIEVVAPGARFPHGLYSTASGRYQFTLPTWKFINAQVGLPDFGPASQDAGCLHYLGIHGVPSMIVAGNIQEAILTCGQSWGWASFAGSTAGQGGKTLGDMLEKYRELTAQV